MLFTHWLISSAPLLGWGLCCLPPGQRRQSRESYVQTELVWKAVWTCTLCMHQESTQAMVSDSSSFFALHSNFSFSGGIENLSLVMYHILTAVTAVQRIREAYSSCVVELCTPLLTTNFPLQSLPPASVIRILLFYCFLKFHMEVELCSTWSSWAG